MYSQAKVIAGGLAHIPVVIAVFYFILTTFNKRLSISSLICSDFIKSGLLNRTYHSSAVLFRYTAPQKVFKWENLPTDSDAYLFPVMSKKYLKEIGYYN